MSSLGRGTMITRGLEGVSLAFDAVRSNKMRASLTILGIAIGVMVVIAMASMITGIRTTVNELATRAGPRTFTVARYFSTGIDISDGSDEMSPWRRFPQLTNSEAKLIATLPGVEAINVASWGGTRVSYGAKQLGNIQVRGMEAAWMRVEGGDMTDGRNFTQVEGASSAFVAVLNEEAVETIFAGLDPIGKVIKLYGLPFTVVGRFTEPSNLFAGLTDPGIVIPRSTFQQVTGEGRNWAGRITVFPRDEFTQAEVMDQVTVALRVKRGLKPAQENNFSLVSSEELVAKFDNITSGFFLVMLLLSSIGLMVGGVGVVAIMMISVTERTREIGVRKALGATLGEIRFQFLVEASTLTLIGGMVGMAMGAVLAWAVNNFSPIPARIPLWSVAAAIIASAVTGIFFGLYPANKAAKLDPIDALRYE